VRKLLKRDVDKDGKIDFDEFEAASMVWVDIKSAVIRGEREKDLSGAIKVNGESVWARLVETDIEEDQVLEYWGSKDESRSTCPGRIPLQEPCAIDDGEDEEDTEFTIIDKTKKRWSIECVDEESFFEWNDAVDDLCDAVMEDGDLVPDEDTLCPGLREKFGR